MTITHNAWYTGENSIFLNGIAPGTSQNQRDGTQVKLLTLDLKGILSIAPLTESPWCSRLLLVYDTNPGGKVKYDNMRTTQPQTIDVLESTAGELSSKITATNGFDKDYSDRFYILWDSFNVHSDWASGGDNKAVKIDISIDLRGLTSLYKDASGDQYADITFGAIYLMCANDLIETEVANQGGLFKGTYRINYQD